MESSRTKVVNSQNNAFEEMVAYFIESPQKDAMVHERLTMPVIRSARKARRMAYLRLRKARIANKIADGLARQAFADLVNAEFGTFSEDLFVERKPTIIRAQKKEEVVKKSAGDAIEEDEVALGHTTVDYPWHLLVLMWLIRLLDGFVPALISDMEWQPTDSLFVNLVRAIACPFVALMTTGTEMVLAWLIALHDRALSTYAAFADVDSDEYFYAEILRRQELVKKCRSMQRKVYFTKHVKKTTLRPFSPKKSFAQIALEVNSKRTQKVAARNAKKTAPKLLKARFGAEHLNRAYEHFDNEDGSLTVKCNNLWYIIPAELEGDALSTYLLTMTMSRSGGKTREEAKILDLEQQSTPEELIAETMRLCNKRYDWKAPEGRQREYTPDPEEINMIKAIENYFVDKVKHSTLQQKLDGAFYAMLAVDIFNVIHAIVSITQRSRTSKTMGGISLVLNLVTCAVHILIYLKGQEIIKQYSTIEGLCKLMTENVLSEGSDDVTGSKYLQVIDNLNGWLMTEENMKGLTKKEKVALNSIHDFCRDTFANLNITASNIERRQATPAQNGNVVATSYTTTAFKYELDWPGRYARDALESVYFRHDVSKIMNGINRASTELVEDGWMCVSPFKLAEVMEAQHINFSFLASVDNFGGTDELYWFHNVDEKPDFLMRRPTPTLRGGNVFLLTNVETPETFEPTGHGMAVEGVNMTSVGFRTGPNWTNTVQRTALNAEAQALSVESGINLAVSMVATLVSVVDLSAGTSYAKNIVLGNSLRKALKETKADMMETINVIANEGFGCHWGPKASTYELLNENMARMRAYHEKTDLDFLHNVALFYEFKNAIYTAESVVNKISLTSRDVDLGLTNLLRNMGVQIEQSKDRIKVITAVLERKVNRQETVAIQLFGKEGSGKTYFITEYLRREVAKRMGYSGDLYTLALEGKYFTPYSGEDLAFYDEFLALNPEPIVPYMNKICSRGYLNMEGADLPSKVQPCNFKALFLASNTPYANLGKQLHGTAENAFYSRLHQYCFINKSQRIGEGGVVTTNRDAVERYSDFRNVEIRKYNTPFRQSSEAIDYDCTIPYSQRRDHSRYVIVKPAEVVEDVVRLLTERRRAFEITANIQAQASQGHLTVCINGPSGTGKTVLANKVGQKLSALTKLDIIRARGTLGLKRLVESAGNAMLRPAIYLLDDAADDEDVFGAFFDSLPDDAVVLNTVNFGIKKRLGLVDAKWTQIWQHKTSVLFGLTVPFFAAGFGVGYYLANLLGYGIGALLASGGFVLHYGGQLWNSTAMCSVITNHPAGQGKKEGYARRIGLTGYIKWAGIIANCEEKNGLHIESFHGYHRYMLGKMVSDEEIADAIITKYRNLRSLEKGIEFFEVDNLDMALMRSADVQLKFESVDKMIETVNSFSKVIDAYMNGTGNAVDNYIRVSEATRNTKSYRFSATMFYIPESVTTNLETLKETAEKTYSTLAKGSPEFTCSIDTPQFRCYCSKGSIQFITSVKVDETRYWAYNDERKTIQIYNHVIPSQCGQSTTVRGEPDGGVPIKSEMVLWREFACDDIGRALAIGLTSLELEVENDVLVYLLDIESQLLRHPSVFAAYNSHTLKEVQCASMLETLETFRYIWKNFVKGAVFKFVGVLLGLVLFLLAFKTALTLFSRNTVQNETDRIIRTMQEEITSLKDTVSDAVALIQPVVHKGKGRVVVKAPPKVSKALEDEISATVAELTHINKKGVAIPIEEVVREEAYDRIDKNDTEQILRKVVQIVQPTSEDYEKEENRKGKEVKRILKFLKNGRAQDYFDNDSSKVDKDKKRTRVPIIANNYSAQAVTTLKPLHADDYKNGILDSTVKAVTNNYVRLTSSLGTVLGLGLKERIIVTTAHVLPDNCNKVDVYMDVNGSERMFTANVLGIDRANEVAFVEINSKQAPQFKDITNKFVKDKWRKKLFITTLPLPRYDANGKYYISQVQSTAQVESFNFALQFDNVNIKPRHNVLVGQLITQYGNHVTRKGDCGGAVIANDAALGHEIILGQHFGAADGSSTFSTFITQEYLESAFNILKIGRGFPQAEEDEKYVELYEKVIGDEVCYLTDEMYDYIEANVHFVNPETVPPVFKQHDPDNTLIFIGHDKKATGVEAKPNKPFVPTPWTKEIAVPNEKIPTPLLVKEVKDDSKLIRWTDHNNVERKSIIFTQLHYYNDKLDSDAYKKYLPAALEYFEEKMITRIGDICLRPLSRVEQVNGLCVRPREPIFEQLEMIDLDSAVGWYGKRLKHNTKRPFFRHIADGRAGQKLYGLDTTTEHGQKMNDFVNLFAYVAEGMGGQVLEPGEDQLKRELLKVEKVNIGGTRLFSSMGLASVLFVRKWCGAYMAACKLRRDVLHGQIGLDPKVEFNARWQRLSKVSPFGEAGDFSRWDKHLQADIMRGIIKVYANLMKRWHPNDEEIIDNAFKVIADLSVSSVMICDKLWYRKTRGMPSGSVLTATLNSDVNQIYHLLISQYLINRHNTIVKLCGGDIKKYQELMEYTDEEMDQFNMRPAVMLKKVNSSFSFIDEVTDQLCYGDDTVVAIRPDVLHIINFKVKARAFPLLFGISYTTPSKDDKVPLFSSIYDLEFLSRMPRKVGSVVLPFIKTSTIGKLLHWISRNDISIAFDNAASALDEMAFYGKKEYDTLRATLEKISKRYTQRSPQFDKMIRTTYKERIRYYTDEIVHSEPVILREFEYEQPNCVAGVSYGNNSKLNVERHPVINSKRKLSI